MRTNTMKKVYANNNAADAFAIGFIYKGYVYGFLCDTAYALEHAQRDKTSKKHGRKACLRLRFTADAKRELTNDYFAEARKLCTVEQFKAQKNSGENNGHVFERLMREKHNGTACEHGAWYECADYNMDYVIKGASGKTIVEWHNIQAKFDGGTFCTAKQCEAVQG